MEACNYIMNDNWKLEKIFQVKLKRTNHKVIHLQNIANQSIFNGTLVIDK